jgi:hypothetical protein
MHRRGHRLAGHAAVLALAWAAGGAMAAGPSTQLTVTGAVTTPASYDAASLAALTPVTQTVSFGSGSGSQTHTYTGARLWDVLSASAITTDPKVKNDILNRYVLATGTDGYKVVFSAGELSPDFGNRPDLVAYAASVGGVPTLLGSDGFARVTAPGDVKGGRYVSNLYNFDVRTSGSTQAGIPGAGTSAQFTVSGAVVHSFSFDLTALQRLTPVTETVGGVSYTGVSFWDLLNSTAGIVVDPLVKNDVLGKYVVATGSDGYKSVFSLGELNPGFGNQPDLIAYSADGASLGANGFARIVVPNDVKKGRWVSNLVSLEVFSASPVPEPGSVATLLLGLAVLARYTRSGVRGRRHSAGPLAARGG